MNTFNQEAVPCRIPLFDLDIGVEEQQAVVEVLRSKWLTMGEVTRRFERAFAQFLNVPYCFAVCNGTAALHLALQALDIGPGDEVICPSLTFVASANAILYTGATPVFADIMGKHNLNISPASIEAKISERSRAVIVVHYAGFPCNMKEILAVTFKYGLKVVEDAAHAPGAELIWKNGTGDEVWMQKVGTIGDIGCFSFFSNKNLATGEGGMIVTRDQRLAERISVMRSHGMTSLTLDRHRGHSYSYDVIALGYNYRIDEIRSAIGLVQLRQLSKKNERRRSLDALYRVELRGIDGLKIPFENFPHRSAYHIFPVLLPEGTDRMPFIQALRMKGIQTSIHYPPIHRFTYYQKSLGRENTDLEWTEYVGSHEVTLPLYPSMKEDDVHYICSCLSDGLKGS
jgi:dTDP-4-amino-4,6-dideoxygalactose transaminase